MDNDFVENDHKNNIPGMTLTDRQYNTLTQYFSEERYDPPVWENIKSFFVFEDYFFCGFNTLFVDVVDVGLGWVRSIGLGDEVCIGVQYIETDEYRHELIDSDHFGYDGNRFLWTNNKKDKRILLENYSAIEDERLQGLPKFGEISEATHWVNPSLVGTKCFVCKEKPATHKVGEELSLSDPTAFANWKGHIVGTRHNLTTEVCCDCFRTMMGEAVPCELNENFIHASQDCICDLCNKPYKKHYTDGVLHYLCNGKKVKL